jgi:heme/copper-type cytochrome/quinol oxidase subunit 2
MLAATSSALAQCAMCKNAVAGSPSATKLAESLNFAIIVLLIPPVLIFCGIFFVAYKYRKARGTEFKSPTDEGLRAKHGSSLQKPQPGNGKRETGGALA